MIPRRALRSAGALSIVAAVLTAADPCAAQSPQDGFVLNGFGTLGATYHNAEGLEFRRNLSQGRGARAGEVDLGTDSLLGLQAGMRFNPELEMSAQGMILRDTDGQWRPRFERGYLRYSYGGFVLARAGRIGFDSYLLAESPAVGYSYLPIRPAPEFYGLFVSDRLDGADVAITQPFAGGIARIRLFGGHNTGDEVLGETRFNASSRMWGVQADYTRHPWLVRVADVYVRADSTADLSQLAATLRAVGTPDASSLANRLSNNGEGVDAFQLGFAYDGRPLQWQLLLTRLESDNITAPQVNSGVLTLGYRFRDVTPFLSFAVIESFARIYPTGVPAVPPLSALDAAAHSVQTLTQPDQHTLSAGLKYDITPKLDIKAQVDHVRVDNPVMVLDRTPFDRSRNMTVVGVALDFLF